MSSHVRSSICQTLFFYSLKDCPEMRILLSLSWKSLVRASSEVSNICVLYGHCLVLVRQGKGGSYMSAHGLNLLNELGKEIKCEACRAFYLFATSLINSIIQEPEFEVLLII